MECSTDGVRQNPGGIKRVTLEMVGLIVAVISYFSAFGCPEPCRSVLLAVPTVVLVLMLLI